MRGAHQFVPLVLLCTTACTPDRSSAENFPPLVQNVRGHQEITIDGTDVRPWFIGTEISAGMCVTAPVQTDTSRWRVALDLDVHAADPKLVTPETRHGATLCSDRTWPVESASDTHLCATIVDDYNGARQRLKCQPIRVSAKDGVSARLATQLEGLLRNADRHGIAAEFVALGDTAVNRGRPITALRSLLIGAHFERRDESPGASHPAAQRLAQAPGWLVSDAAHAIAGQFHYEHAMNALRRGHLPDAWRAIVDANVRFSAIAHPKTIVAATRRAQVLHRSGAYDEARRDLARALAQCAKSPCEALLQRDAGNTLAWWFMHTGEATADDLERAESLLLDSFAGTSGTERANALLNRAFLHTLRDQDPTILLDEATTVLGAMRGERAQTLRHWHTFIAARYAYQSDNPHRALTLLDQIEDSPADTAIAARTHHLRGRLLRDAGQFEAAWVQFQRASQQHALINPLMQRIPLSPGQRTANYYALAMTAVELGKPELAWAALFELDHLADRDTCVASGDDTTQRLTSLMRVIDQTQSTASVQRRNQRRDARVELRLLQRTLTRTTRQCQFTTPAKEIADTAHLRIFSYDSEIVVLARSAEGHVRLDKRTAFKPNEIQHMVDRLERLVGDESADDKDWRAASNALAKALLPNAAAIAGDVTAVALHGVLQRVPLAALPFGEGWFSDVTTVVAVPAGRVAPRQVNGEREGGTIVVDPSGNLASARQSTEFFTRTFPRAKLIVGADARLDSVVQSARHARWLHIDAHGAADQDFIDLYALRMADGLLYAAQLTDVANGLEFANLSSCRSARFEVTADSGQWGLGGALARMGVPWVIAARHDLDDRAAAHFNRHFYARYQQSGSVSDAYEQAIRALRQKYPARIWAGLMLIGPAGGQTRTTLTPHSIAQSVRQPDRNTANTQ